jgi:hypothetical protein
MFLNGVSISLGQRTYLITKGRIMKAIDIKFLVISLVFVAACVSIAPPAFADIAMESKSSSSDGERLISSSAKERPDWIMEEPSARDGFMFFVGLSENQSTEARSREDALGNATKNVVKYMGTLVKAQFEKKTLSLGLASAVEDPTVGVNAYEKQLAVNMAKNVKASKWYFERWQLPTGVAVRYFVLASIPENKLQEINKSVAAGMVKKSEQIAAEASTDTAQKQAQKTVEFWKQMRDQGMLEDNAANEAKAAIPASPANAANPAR